MSTVKRRTAFLVALVVSLSLLCIPSARAFASSEMSTSDVAAMASSMNAGSSNASFLSGGNQFLADEAPAGDVEADLFWAGMSLNYNKAIGGNAFVAGQQIDLARATVGHDVYAAGETVTIADSSIGGSVFAAGSTIKVSGTTKARAVYAAGETIVVNGQYVDVVAGGQDISLLGTVAGDAHLDGENITIGQDAKVAGTLYVTSPTEPTVNAANVPNVQWTQTQQSSGVDEGTLMGIGIAGTIIFAIIGILSTLVCALLIRLFFRRAVDDGAAMVTARPVPVIVTGLIAAFFGAPIGFIILLCLGITWPLAVAVLLAALIVTVVAVPFTAAALAPLVFKKMNRYGSTAICALILGVLSAIPFLGGLVLLCCFVYMLGYVLQAIFLRMKKTPDMNAPTGNPVPVPGTPVPVVPVAGSAPVTAEQTTPLANTPLSPTGAAIPTTGVPVPAVAPDVSIPEETPADAAEQADQKPEDK